MKAAQREWEREQLLNKVMTGKGGMSGEKSYRKGVRFESPMAGRMRSKKVALTKGSAWVKEKSKEPPRQRRARKCRPIVGVNIGGASWKKKTCSGQTGFSPYQE